MLDDADAATARGTLGAQAADATLTALAGVVTAANQLIYATGADTFATTSLSAFARTLLDDADAATARGTLGTPAGEDKQLCTAWVNFNGTGVVSIRDSYNVSSIIDNGTGDYRVNLSTSMLNSNYCAVANCSDPNASGGGNSAVNIQTRALSYIDILIAQGGTNGKEDSDSISLVAFGGK